MKHISVKLILAVSILIAVVWATIAFLNLISDAPKPDVSDLILERQEIADEDNAYSYFLSASEAYYWSDDKEEAQLISDYRDDKPVEEKQILAILSKNASAIKLIEQGSRCRMCLTPEVTGFDTSMPYLGQWIQMGRILAMKAKYERMTDRHTDASNTCMILFKFGNLIQSDAQTLITHLSGVALSDIACDEAQNLVRDNDLPDESLAMLLETMASLDSLNSGLINALKGEFKLINSTIDRIKNSENDISTLLGLAPGKFPKKLPRYTFQPNKTKLIFAHEFRAMIENVPHYFSDMKYKNHESPNTNNLLSKIARIVRPNSIGYILFSLIMPAHPRLLEEKCQKECNLTATRIIIALHLYRKAKNQFPSSLDQLVPDYLSIRHRHRIETLSQTLRGASGSYS